MGSMSYGLNSLKGGVMGDTIGDYCRVLEEDTRSLDYVWLTWG